MTGGESREQPHSGAQSGKLAQAYNRLRQKKLETYRIAFLQVGNVRYGMTLWEDAWEEGYPVADKLTENDKLRLLVS